MEHPGGPPVAPVSIRPVPASDVPALGSPSPPRIYVGIDVGYREHVVAACPLTTFNRHRSGDAWKRAKALRFGSDADGFLKLQAYLSEFSPNPDDFLVLLEPTGGYYAVAIQAYLLE